MKKVYLLIGLLLYSTTPLAKTLMMECFVDMSQAIPELKLLGLDSGTKHSMGITKLETDETNDSHDLITLRTDGVWKGGCHKPQIVCSQGDESVVVEEKEQETGEKMKLVYDFRFLTFYQVGKVLNSETNELEELEFEGTCERINL